MNTFILPFKIDGKGFVVSQIKTLLSACLPKKTDDKLYLCCQPSEHCRLLKKNRKIIMLSVVLCRQGLTSNYVFAVCKDEKLTAKSGIDGRFPDSCSVVAYVHRRRWLQCSSSL